MPKAIRYKITNASLKILLIIFLVFSPMGVRSNIAPSSTHGLEKEIGRGSVSLLLRVNLPPKHSGTNVSFNLNSFNVVQFDMQGSPELQAFVKQLQQDINSGAIQGLVKVNSRMAAIRATDSYGYPAAVSFSFKNNRAGARASITPSASGLIGDILFNGFINEWKGIGSDNLKLNATAPITLALEMVTAGRPVRGAGSGDIFKTSINKGTIPGVEFGTLQVNVTKWGNTPAELKALRRVQITANADSFQYDAASGMVAGKYTIIVIQN